MNVLSLFAGIGGLELGLERAGMTVVGQVEIDPFCRQVLATHWPEVPRHGNVRTCIRWWRSRPRPAVHVVAGGFPCQPHSTAGTQRGQADERWGWPWFRDVVEAVEPPFVLIENVPNLVRTGLGDVLGDLAALGFDAWWGCVPAAAVGAPHLRWRLFVLAAHPGRVALRDEPGWGGGARRSGPTITGHDGATWALADPDGAAGRQPRSGVGGDGSAPVLRGGPPESRRRGGDLADSDSQPSVRAPVARGERNPWSTEPDVGRVANGVPYRVDRLRALGNAVVPQVAEHIGRLIVAADMASEVAA